MTIRQADHSESGYPVQQTSNGNAASVTAGSHFGPAYACAAAFITLFLSMMLNVRALGIFVVVSILALVLVLICVLLLRTEPPKKD